jgi:hypothetical protein
LCSKNGKDCQKETDVSLQSTHCPKYGKFEHKNNKKVNH